MININDSFISDDEEECCPLCVEEMDISDKNFKPCPCGYQVCQFCYNNIRNNPELNGKCPGCRRPYDDESVEYKVVSTEEWKVEQGKQTKRDREKKQREKERKEHDQANRKHLAGMRVIQKNLVYVVGLNLNVPAEELHTLLRSDKYFGQYGKILKIVINKKNQPPAVQSLAHFHSTNSGFGVYVTFSKKEEASKCIAAIDGTYSDGKLLRAAHGTTKYCSSYLRGLPCPNPNCMFLHEPGEEADSYTRQDLSTRQGLKMEGEGFKNNAFQRGYFDDPHPPMGHSPTVTHAQPSSSASSTPSLHQPLLNTAPLPVTSSWASSSKPASTPVALPTPLANSSAFPTLAESTTLQQIQQQEQQKQQQQQRKQKSNNNQQTDEYNPEATAIAFIDETINNLKIFQNFQFQIKSTFYEGELNEKEIESYPSLVSSGNFKVEPMSSNKRNASSFFQVKLIESLIAKPKLLHHVQQAQQERLKLQQQQQLLLQQQQQQLAQAQIQAQLAAAAQAQSQLHQTPHQIPPQLHDPQQQQQQQFNSQIQNSNANAQQQYATRNNQQILLEQLQQSQSQLQGVATPPPGLFTVNAAPSSAGTNTIFQSTGAPAQQPQQQQHQGSIGGSASELLSHLMKGKMATA